MVVFPSVVCVFFESTPPLFDFRRLFGFFVVKQSFASNAELRFPPPFLFFFFYFFLVRCPPPPPGRLETIFFSCCPAV